MKPIHTEKPAADDWRAVRAAVAAISGEASNDAVGARVARLEEIFAPATHAAALDPRTPIVLGSRGSGKSFWAGVLGQASTREAAALAYPRLGLARMEVHFGYTGIGGPDGISAEAIDSAVPPDADIEQAKTFWWATLLCAAARSGGQATARPSQFIEAARDWTIREDLLAGHERRLRDAGKGLLVVYDALDTVARTWPRRRLLTEALLEVVWAMRAYQAIRPKLFLRPDQIGDDALRFVELPKLRAGAVRLVWSATDLYGLLFARLVMSEEEGAGPAFARLLREHGFKGADRSEILTRRWPLVTERDAQRRFMAAVAGEYMGQGAFAYKKGNTYDWPLTHLADAFGEVTPRSFLGMMVAAARFGAAPDDRVLSADGIRHGLREASKTRVDQLHLEFPWIKGVLAPLAGLLLPQEEGAVFDAWRQARTLARLLADAEQHDYLPPFPGAQRPSERDLFAALERIGVMFRCQDGRLDLPDLFRVAAKLLTKRAIAPA